MFDRKVMGSIVTALILIPLLLVSSLAVARYNTTPKVVVPITLRAKFEPHFLTRLQTYNIDRPTMAIVRFVTDPKLIGMTVEGLKPYALFLFVRSHDAKLFEAFELMPTIVVWVQALRIPLLASYGFVDYISDGEEEGLCCIHVHPS